MNFSGKMLTGVGLATGLALVLGFVCVHKAGWAALGLSGRNTVPPERLILNLEGWPCWRGPDGDGRAPSAILPSAWSSEAGAVWKVAVPGRGHSSPVVSGQRVFVTTADDDTETITALCYHLETGVLAWSTPVHQGGFMRRHDKNSHASATPAWDGERLFVPFVADDALWVAAVDGAGTLVWKTQAGPFSSAWGNGSSPALHKNLLILASDTKDSRTAQGATYLIALDRYTGDVVWKTARPGSASYASPVVVTSGGHSQIVLSGGKHLKSYDPDTGRELWSCRVQMKRTDATVGVGPGCVLALAKHSERRLTCVRTDGTGDVSGSHVLWQQTRVASDIPSPVYHDGYFYLVNGTGVAFCLRADTGAIVWQERLGAAFCASPLLVGDKLLAVDEEGTAFVLQAGPRFELVASHSLDDSVYATPAPTGDHLIIRSHRFLWCLGGKATPTQVTSGTRR